MRVKITGGPGPATIKVIDMDTGEDLTRDVLEIHWHATRNDLAHVTLIIREASVDVEGEVTT